MNNKLFVLAAAAAITLTAALSATAAEPCDLVFKQEQGGKYIYCNNIERVRESDLADKSNQYAKFIMNNDALTPDRYILFTALLNQTDYGSDNKPTGKRGFDIDADVLFRAEEDTEITISRLGFEVPEHQKFFLDGTQYLLENEWGGFNSWASYFGIPIRQINSGNVYEPTEFNEITLTIKAGEEVWLSEYIPNYRETPLRRSVHILADFTINSGVCDVEIAALRSTGTPGDRSNFNPNSAFGSYVRDKQYKGISDGLNEVTAELKYTIDDSVGNGYKLPVTVYNQYVPEGNTITEWYTQLNPRADEWSYDICAESDMLQFNYYDPSKLRYYGSSVPDSEKDEYYHFDTSHTDLAEYDKAYGSYSKYKPNAEMTDSDDRDYACNLGNYGVIYNYNIEIENTGYKTRYLIYKLATASNNFVYVKDSDGNIMNDRILCKGQKSTRISDDMACLVLPAQSTKKYTICVVLAANFAGGMQNSFVISDYQSPIETYETERSGILKDRFFDGREYYSWNGGKLNLSDDNETWRTVELPETVMNGISGNLNEYQLIWTGSGYAIRPTIYDAGAFSYIDYMYREMYLLDESFSLVAKKTFGSYPQDFSCANGVYYVKTSGSVYSSTSAFKWWDLTEHDLPCWNYGTFSALCENGKISLSTDGLTFDEVDYKDFEPEYIDSNGEYYYYAEGRTLYLSKDGIYWRNITFNNKIKSFAVTDGNVVANGSEARALPEFNDTVAIKLNGKYISTETESLLIKNSPFIPIRTVCELLGYDVKWNDGTVELSKANESVEISDIRIIDNTAYAPLKVLREDLGISVEYDGVNAVAVITTETK